MKSKLIAFVVFVIFATGCSSSASAPEEATQVEAQSFTETTQEEVLIKQWEEQELDKYY